MIETSTFLTYVLIVLGFVFIPGPATLMTVARATTSVMRVGFATACGVAVGDFIHTLMAAIGISAVIAASAIAFSVVKYIGAAYLLYLGIKALVTRKTPDLGGGMVAVSAGTAFRQAVFTEVLNPKTALFFLAFLPQFVHPENGLPILQLIILGLVVVVLGLFSTAVFAACAGGLGNFLRRWPGVMKWQGKVVGGIYCALGLRLAFQDR